MVVVTAIVNPLNVVSATDKASQDIFFRYIAPLYGKEQQPITVILLDDDFVERVGSSWPVPHRTMTRFLQTLYCYAPKSVFFDLLFTHEHSGERQTERFIDYLKGGEKVQDRVVQQCAKGFVDRAAFESEADGFDAGGYEAAIEAEEARLRDALLPLPPAYIGDLAPQKNYPVEDDSAIFDALRKERVAKLPTNWVADDGAYPLVVTLDDQVAYGAPGPAAKGVGMAGVIKDGKADIWQDSWPDHVDGKVPSAALALYASLQESEDEARLEPKARKAAADQRLAELIADEQRLQIVEWGFYPRHLPEEAMTAAELESDRKAKQAGLPGQYLRLRQFPDGCKPRPRDISPAVLGSVPPVDRAVQSFAPFTESVWQFLLDTVGVLNRRPDQPRQACPYNQWVPGEAVLFASSQAQKETLRALFEDRAVLIGADIRGAPDLVQSPVHGQIPGVFLHAMALDNLLERGLEGYWRPMPTLPETSYLPAFITDMSIGTSIEMGLLWSIFAFSSLIALWRKKAGERVSEKVYLGAELLGHVVLVFGTVSALAAHAIAPMNWLGLVTLAVSKDILQRFRFELPKLESESLVRLRSRLTG